MATSTFYLCYGFKVNGPSLPAKDRELLMSGIDDFKLMPTDTFGSYESPWYFGLWMTTQYEEEDAVFIDPIDMVSIQSDVDLNRKLMNYAHDLCKVSADLLPTWRVVRVTKRN